MTSTDARLEKAHYWAVGEVRGEVDASSREARVPEVQLASAEEGFLEVDPAGAEGAVQETHRAP
ncbi:hypothetical protein ACFVP0_18750 [Streptomyces cinereoruber]|uniref:hypothetical protein n=1 Tax=Streptomyces cinereoruber TaxID=67260 RepID=UPI0036A6BB53